MNGLRLLCLVFAFFADLSSSAAERPLRVSLIDYYPLNGFEGQEPEGFVFDYVADILKSLNRPLSFSLVTVNRAHEQLRNEQVDLVLAMMKHKARKAYIQYSGKPLLEVSSGFCTVTPISRQRFDAKSRLAFVQGSIVPESLRFMIQTAVSGENAQDRMLQMLVKGRADLIQAPIPEVMIYAAHRAGYSIQLFCYELKGSRVPVHIAFARSVPAELVKKVDEALEKQLAVEPFDHYMRRRFEQLGVRTPTLSVVDPSLFTVRP